jgi:hypothetical protein
VGLSYITIIRRKGGKKQSITAKKYKFGNSRVLPYRKRILIRPWEWELDLRKVSAFYMKKMRPKITMNELKRGSLLQLGSIW